MAIIWLIEDESKQAYCLIDRMSADFPVRRIASVESLHALYAFEHPERRPNLLIVNDSHSKDHMAIMAAAHVLERIRTHSLIAITESSSQEWLSICRGLDIPRLDLSTPDGLSLKTQIEGILAISAARQSHQRPPAATEQDFLTLGDIMFHKAKCALQIQGASKEILPPKEARILEILVTRPNRCVTRAQIAELAWPGVRISDRTLDSHVSRLRRKISESFECSIEAIYGEGYMFRVGRDEF